MSWRDKKTNKQDEPYKHRMSLTNVFKIKMKLIEMSIINAMSTIMPSLNASLNIIQDITIKLQIKNVSSMTQL